MVPPGLPPPILVGSQLLGFVEPARGAGKLIYYPDAGDPQGGGRIEFTLVSKRPVGTDLRTWGPLRYGPWHTTGWQPFAWDLMPPVGERTYPVIRLILGRSVEFEMKRFPGMKPESRPSAIGVLSTYSPFVAVFRPQDDTLIPQPGEPIEQSHFLPEPYRVGPENDREGLNALGTVVVTTKPMGVEIRNINNGYVVEFGLDARKPERQGAFAYEVSVSEPHATLVTIRVVYSGKAFINATVHEDYESALFLRANGVNLPENVPPQGASLDAFQLHPVETEVIKKPDPRGLAIFFLELGIAFIPYVGALYFISQFAYAACTGKDFWGRDVGTGDLFVMGVTALVPVGLRAAQEIRALRAGLKGSPLARALDEGVTLEVRRVAQQELLTAVGEMDVKTATELARQLTLYASGKATAAQILQQFNKSVGDAYLRVLARRAIDRYLTADFQNFKNAQLASGYRQYLAKQAKKAGSDVADPLTWAMAQRGASRYVRELEKELGTNWQDAIRLARKDIRLQPLAPGEIKHYDSLAGRVEDYKTLAKLNKGHGELFEVDHILEQRFWRNDPRVATALDEKGEGMAMLVPLNPAVAAKMPGRPITYVHTTKTQMLADLIPNGREAQFSVQQIWDAHIFVLESLGVDRSVTRGDRLLDSFRMLARARGEALDLRIPTSSIFTREGKWPFFPGS